MSDERGRDDELLQELRALIEKADAPPPEVSEFAKAALGWRRLDTDLAELLADSVLDASGVRSGEGARRLSFEAGDLSLDLEVRPEGEARQLLGQVAPSAAAAAVEVQSGDGELLATAVCDQLGRFRLSLRSGGRVRLRIRREPPAAPVETSWFSL
jgi:hypothetical protein